jgi:hypothetical protein
MTYVAKPCRCPVCKVPPDERAARLEEILRPERERQEAMERAKRDRWNATRRARRAAARKGGVYRSHGAFCVKLPGGFTYLMADADAALDAWNDFRATGQRPLGFVLISDWPEGLRP